MKGHGFCVNQTPVQKMPFQDVSLNFIKSTLITFFYSTFLILWLVSMVFMLRKASLNSCSPPHPSTFNIFFNATKRPLIIGSVFLFIVITCVSTVMIRVLYAFNYVSSPRHVINGHLQHWINNIVLLYAILVQSHNKIDHNNAILNEDRNVPNDIFLLAAITTSERLIVSVRYLSESEF
jgi:hypothetical protein